MQILLLIMQLFPLMLEAIQKIEATAAIAKVGPAKLQLVRQVTAAAYGTTPQQFGSKLISQDQLLSIIEAITMSIVAFYNLVGIFKTSPQPAPAPVSS